MENKRYILTKDLNNEKVIDKDLCEDYDDEGELDVEYYPIPYSLLEALEE